MLHSQYPKRFRQTMGRQLLAAAMTLILCVAMLYSPGFAGAQSATITWTGESGDGSWHNAANWDLGRTPDNGDLVVIGQNETVEYSTGTIRVQLNCAGELTVSDGDLKLADCSTLTDGKLDGAGTITIDSGSSLLWSGGSIEGTGVLRIEAAASLNITTTYAILNRSLAGYGMVTVTGAGFAPLNSWVNYGGLDIANGGSLELGASQTYLLGNYINNSGSLIIFDTGDVVYVHNNYSQYSLGSLTFIVGGSDSFSQLVVSGRASLAGELHVELASYSPSIGDTFEVLTYESYDGEFSSISTNRDDAYIFLPTYGETGLTLTVADATTPSVPEFADGSGDGLTAANAFLIATPEHLNNMRNYLGTEHADKHFKLIENISLNVPPYNQGEGWVPIGTADDPFTGTFDGNAKIISGLTINRPNTTQVGMFGVVSGGIIRDLSLQNATISGRMSVGTLVGFNNGGQISGCHVLGSTTGHSEVGSLVGENNSGTISNSTTQGTVIGQNNNIGGLIGWSESGNVSNSHSAVAVSGNMCVGGLIGRNYSGNVNISSATGNVTGSSEYIGGLVGSFTRGTINDCYASGTVSGDEDTGGLVGQSWSASITNSYASGRASVPGSYGGYVGGLVGFLDETTVSNCYATGGAEGWLQVGGIAGSVYKSSITNSYCSGAAIGALQVGGIIGYNDQGTIVDSFFDENCTGHTESVGEAGATTSPTGGLGLSTETMKQQETFTNAGWSFTGDTPVWKIQEGTTYPHLYWESSFRDTAPPAFTSGCPLLASVDSTTATLSLQCDENATVYYVAVATGADKPSATNIKAGRGHSGSTPVAAGTISVIADQSANVTINGLQADTCYDVYFVAEDTAGNLQPDMSIVLVPVITTQAALSDEARILSFTLAEQLDNTVINPYARTVVIKVRRGTSLASLVPTITVSAGATINPGSAVAQNFSSPVTYTVTAEDGTIQLWSVDVREEKPWIYRSPLPTYNTLKDAKYLNGRFIVLGENGIILTSANGQDWLVTDLETTASFQSVAYGNGLYVIAGRINDQGLIYISTDGLTWHLVFTLNNYQMAGVAFGDGKFVVVGQSGKVLTSADGLTWEVRQVPSITELLLSVTYADGVFVAVGGRENKGFAATSLDGTSWTARSLPSGFDIYPLWDVAYGAGKFVAVGGRYGEYQTARIYTSVDNGVTWTHNSPTSIAFLRLNSIVHDGSRFISVGYFANIASPSGFDGYIVTSTNGTSWTQVSPLSTSISLNAVTVGNGIYIAAGGYGNLWATTTPTNAASWSALSSGLSRNLNDVAYNGELYVAVGVKGAVQTSPDGITWDTRTIGSAMSLETVRYLNNEFIAVGEKGEIARSSDGLIWTRQSLGLSVPLLDISFGNGMYVAVGGSGYSAVIATSENGSSWTTVNHGYSIPFVAVEFGNGHFIAFGQNGQVYISTNGVDWPLTNLPGSGRYPTYITFANGMFIGCGSSGQVYISTDNGQSWSISNTDFRYYLNAVAYLGGRMIAVSQYGKIFSSCDNGQTWAEQPNGLYNDVDLRGIVAGNSAFIAVGDRGITLQSIDFGTEPDLIPPTWPTGQLTASNVSHTSVTLTWTAAADNIEVTGYRVFRDAAIEMTLGNVLTFTVEGLTPDKSYTFSVEACDAAGNWSTNGPQANVHTLCTLESISVTTAPNKTTYYVGEEIILDGLVVTATHIDSTTEELTITMDHISGFDSSSVASGLVVTVTYRGKIATFSVEIVAPPAQIFSTAPSILWEAEANDGSLSSGEIVITLTNGTLAADIAKADVTAANLPSGFDYTVQWDSETQLTIIITGKATAHSASDSISNLTFTISQGKVNGAAGNLSTEDISISFNDPSSNADLSALTITAGTFAPVFDSATTTYSASVSSSVSSIGITATAADNKATITINQGSVVSGSTATISLNTGSNTITIAVTAENGTLKNYTLIVSRASSGGPIIPPYEEPDPQPQPLPSIPVTPPPAVENGATTLSPESTTSTDEEGIVTETFKITEDAVKTVEQAIAAGASTINIQLGTPSSAPTQANITIDPTVLSAAQSASITLETPAATLTLPPALVQALAEQGQPLNIVVNRTAPEVVADETPSGSEVVAPPLSVATDITGTTQLNMPLSLILPANELAREAFLISLGLFAIHSDGEKGLIQNLEFDIDTTATPPVLTGVRFSVDKFSKFALIKLTREPLTLTVGAPGFVLAGKAKDMAAAYYKGNDTMMAVRMLEDYGVSFVWDEASMTATLSYKSNVIKLTIGSTEAYINGVRTAIVGASGSLVAPELAPGRIMIPLRFVSEHLGFNVHWDPSNIITIWPK